MTENEKARKRKRLIKHGGVKAESLGKRRGSEREKANKKWREKAEKGLEREKSNKVRKGKRLRPGEEAEKGWEREKADKGLKDGED
jgi:hypothetical protein